MSPVKRLLTLTAIGLTLLLALGIYRLIPPSSFDPEVWQQTPIDQRRPLAEAFLRQYRVRGMTWIQVKGLLGDPNTDSQNWYYGLDPSAAQPGVYAATLPRLCVTFKQNQVIYVCLERVDQSDPLPPDLAFTEQSWRRASVAQRLRMVGDLIQGENLIGQPTSAVQQILGTPQDQTHSVTYELGMDLMGIDGVWMNLDLDSQDQVLRGDIVWG